MNAADVVGYAYEADAHCVSCAEKRFGKEALDKHPEDEDAATDSEGIPVTPIFAGGGDDTETCPTCSGNGQHTCPDESCNNTHDCGACEGTGDTVAHCGDCGEALYEG